MDFGFGPHCPNVSCGSSADIMMNDSTEGLATIPGAFERPMSASCFFLGAGGANRLRLRMRMAFPEVRISGTVPLRYRTSRTWWNW